MELIINSLSRQEDIYGKLYTDTAQKKVPLFSLKNAESVYRIPSSQGNIIIDNKNGLGQTPDNQNVLYKGCIGFMDVAKLIEVLPNMRTREQESYAMLRLIKEGYSIGSPCLYVDIDPFMDKQPGNAKFTGHEGRARIWAMYKMGVREFPMQLLFLGYRARHIKNSEEFEHWLNSGVQLEKSSKVLPSLFKRILIG